jgi:hypothetical protein
MGVILFFNGTFRAFRSIELRVSQSHEVIIIEKIPLVAVRASSSNLLMRKGPLHVAGISLLQSALPRQNSGKK